MKFKIQRDQLLKPLQLINGVVERRQTLPVLGNVLITTHGNQLRLTGSDLEVELTGTTEAVDMIEGGEITVPARKMFDICRSLPEATEMTLQVDNHKLLVQANNSRFSLLTLPAIEYPKVKDTFEGVSFNIPAQQLKELIESTEFAMAQQDVRYYLNGSLWQLEGARFSCVATDGHRLALRHYDLAEPVKQPAKVIVPRKAIAEMARVMAELSGDSIVNLMMGQHHIKLTAGTTILISKLIDGRFPDYQNVIPRHNQFLMNVDRDILKPVLQRVSILSNEKARGVRLSLKENELRVVANNPEHEEAEEFLPVEYQGDVLEIGLNVGYLLDVLNTSPKGSIQFAFGGGEKSVLIEPKNGVAALNVIMPMRL